MRPSAPSERPSSAPGRGTSVRPAQRSGRRCGRVLDLDLDPAQGFAHGATMVSQGPEGDEVGQVVLRIHAHEVGEGWP